MILSYQFLVDCQVRQALCVEFRDLRSRKRTNVQTVAETRAVNTSDQLHNRANHTIRPKSVPKHLDNSNCLPVLSSQQYLSLSLSLYRTFSLHGWFHEHHHIGPQTSRMTGSPNMKSVFSPSHERHEQACIVQGEI